METLINLAILALAALGGLYALGLIIIAIIGPPTINDDTCECERCNE